MGLLFNNLGETVFTLGNISNSKNGTSVILGNDNNKVLSNNKGNCYKTENMYYVNGNTFMKSRSSIYGNGKLYNISGKTITSTSGKIWYGVESDDDIFRILVEDN